MVKNNLTIIQELKDTIASLSSKLKGLDNKLLVSHSAFLNIVEKSLDGIIVLDKNKVIVYSNPMAMQLLCGNKTDLLGETLDIDVDKTSVFIKIPHADGHILIIEASIHPTQWNDKFGYLVNLRNTECKEKEFEEKLSHISLHDPLTGLPNRVHFENLVSFVLNQAKLEKNNFAVLVINMNNFRIINGTYGYETGNMFLKKIANILQLNTNKKDIIGKTDNDEFAIGMLVSNSADAKKIAKKLLKKLSILIDIEGKEIIANPKMGIAVYPKGGETAQKLIKNAGAALYCARQGDKNKSICFYNSPRINPRKNSEIFQGLMHIATQNELFLEYQPIYSLKNLKFFGIETLIRWKHPTLGVLLPEEFLPQAKSLGLMHRIDYWVINHALQDYISLEKICKFLTLNLSLDESEGLFVIDHLLHRIKQLKLTTPNIIVELTEATILQHPQLAIKKLQQLVRAGIKIAIDDYGAGYSSLSYIKHLPVSIVKIDKQFIKDIEDKENISNALIVKSTVSLAHNLKLKVVAEGVETQEQLDFLKKLKCDYVQGFHLSKPMKLEALLNKYQF